MTYAAKQPPDLPNNKHIRKENNTMNELLEKFGTIYTALYNRTYTGPTAGLVEKFDSLLKTDPDFKALVCDFVKAREDFISSDREAAAFMLAIRDTYKY